jgi:hypothetical protein
MDGTQPVVSTAAAVTRVSTFIGTSTVILASRNGAVVRRS